VRIVVAAPGVPAEAFPVETAGRRRRNRLARARDAVRRATAATAGGEQTPGEEEQS
jgi:hypothetical protein